MLVKRVATTAIDLDSSASGKKAGDLAQSVMAASLHGLRPTLLNTPKSHLHFGCCSTPGPKPGESTGHNLLSRLRLPLGLTGLAVRRSPFTARIHPASWRSSWPFIHLSNG
jgi:hypothetical protein